jgi:TetR/AcrR family transcriptional regulator, mexCD-oprJ operon repressor
MNLANLYTDVQVISRGPSMRTAGTQARRADARKNIAAILDAATTSLARDPDASINDIARAAGVGRVTLYGHFESRAGLLAAVVDRAMAATERDLSAVDVTGDPTEAMRRLLGVTWDLTYRYGALIVAAQRTLPAQDFHDAHEKPIRRMQALLRRGRRSGAFRTDMPLDWQITLIQSVLHGASDATYRGELSADKAGRLVAESVLAALRPDR